MINTSEINQILQRGDKKEIIQLIEKGQILPQVHFMSSKVKVEPKMVEEIAKEYCKDMIDDERWTYDTIKTIGPIMAIYINYLVPFDKVEHQDTSNPKSSSESAIEFASVIKLYLAYNLLKDSNHEHRDGYNVHVTICDHINSVRPDCRLTYEEIVCLGKKCLKDIIPQEDVDANAKARKELDDVIDKMEKLKPTAPSGFLGINGIFSRPRYDRYYAAWKKSFEAMVNFRDQDLYPSWKDPNYKHLYDLPVDPYFCDFITTETESIYKTLKLLILEYSATIPLDSENVRPSLDEAFPEIIINSESTASSVQL